MAEAEIEIKKCDDMGRITKRQHDTLMRHAEHHTFAHIRKMLDQMGKGSSFTAAHKAVKDSVQYLNGGGGAKSQLEEYYAWLRVQDDLGAQAAYEEAQSRLRMSCLCKEMRRYLSYPLTNRIVELSYLSKKKEYD